MRSRRAVKIFSDAVAELHRPACLDEFRPSVMRVLRMVIDSDINSYTEVNLRTGRIVGVLDVPAMDEREAADRMGLFVHEHPLVQHYAQTGSTQAHQITDFITQREFESRGIYCELYRLMNVRKQMAISIAGGDGTVLGAIVNRTSRDFSAHDRSMLDLLGKHLSQAYENAVRLTQLQDQHDAQAAAIAHAGIGVIVIDGGGNVVSQSDASVAILAGLDGMSGSPRRLPDLVRRWVSRLLADAPNVSPALCRLVLPHAGGSRVAIITYSGSPRPGRHALLVQCDPSALPVPRLLEAGLTPREAEVLQWVAHGKTNAETASILGTSPRTVQKHVERILAKLHVETRAAAVARAREL
jgi:DNA-binding CsgD family transcriptional regulator